MNSWKLAIGMVAFASCLVVVIFVSVMVGNSRVELRRQIANDSQDFVQVCVDNGGSLIEEYRGHISCVFPPGIIPPDLNNHP